MVEPLTGEEFLDKKRDYSPLLVHLTKDYLDGDGNIVLPAKSVLDMILSETELKAFNYFCIFKDGLDSLDVAIKNKFRVVCFTETPIDQIDMLLYEVRGKKLKHAPYGLVFKKEDIRKKGGNPVFYLAGNLSLPLWKLFNNAGETQYSEGENKVLALVNKCDDSIDFHWEREWRIVGSLKFEIADIYCGLCPGEEISYFEGKYPPIVFISPRWGIGKILDKLVRR